MCNPRILQHGLLNKSSYYYSFQNVRNVPMAKSALLTAGGVCAHQDPEDLAASSALLDTFLDHPLGAILADVELVHYPVSTHLSSRRYI